MLSLGCVAATNTTIPREARTVYRAGDVRSMGIRACYVRATVSLPRFADALAIAMACGPLLLGCPDHHGSTNAEPAQRPGNVGDRSSRRDVVDFVDRQLAMRGAQFAGTLVQVGPVLRGTLPQGGNASHTFEIIGGHCYRIIAVGDVDVNDLDLALFGPDGTQVDSDTQGETYPVLGGVRPLCPPNGGTYRIEVRMHDGQGAYGLEIFRTP
jgi:hypothetical protein